MDFIAGFSRRTGLLLDPVYTGKALYACDRALRHGELNLPRDLLFVHTGGIFGLFPYRRAVGGAIRSADLNDGQSAASARPCIDRREHHGS